MIMKKRNTLWILVLIFIILMGISSQAQNKFSVKELSDQYSKATEKTDRHKILKELSKTEPVILEDVTQVRQIISNKEWDEDLFVAAADSIRRIKNAGLDVELIEILKDEKIFIEKISRGDLSGKSEREAKYRVKNVEFIIKKLGELKSQRAVPILQEYLKVKGLQYAASEALGKIRDKSASEEMRERAYRGEEINYGGLGLDEAVKVMQDLEDKGKKDKWPKIAKQIILIKDPKAKPYLKKLFSHEKYYVRQQSATAFGLLANENDVSDVLEMAKNKDEYVRFSSIDAMKKINDPKFITVLFDLLINDKIYIVRSNAAKALGYKKITSAVPYLDKALNDKEFEVRREAFIALYILTGKKYDFKGWDSATDQQAENQKKNPTFY